MEQLSDEMKLALMESILGPQWAAERKRRLSLSPEQAQEEAEARARESARISENLKKLKDECERKVRLLKELDEKFPGETWPKIPLPTPARRGEEDDEMSVVQKETTYRLLSLAAEEFPQLAGVLSESGHANATVCPYCRVDDFVHVEGCRLEHSHEEDARKLRHFEAMERACRSLIASHDGTDPSPEHAYCDAVNGARTALAAYDADKE